MEFMIDDAFMVAWTPASQKFSNSLSGGIAIGPWPDRVGWADRYLLSVGCCDAGFENLKPEQKAQELRNLFVRLVLEDGLNWQTVQEEFMKLEIWREMKTDGLCGSHRRRSIHFH